MRVLYNMHLCTPKSAKYSSTLNVRSLDGIYRANEDSVRSKKSILENEMRSGVGPKRSLAIFLKTSKSTWIGFSSFSVEYGGTMRCQCTRILLSLAPCKYLLNLNPASAKRGVVLWSLAIHCLDKKL